KNAGFKCTRLGRAAVKFDTELTEATLLEHWYSSDTCRNAFFEPCRKHRNFLRKAFFGQRDSSGRSVRFSQPLGNVVVRSSVFLRLVVRRPVSSRRNRRAFL